MLEPKLNKLSGLNPTDKDIADKVLNPNYSKLGVQPIVSTPVDAVRVVDENAIQANIISEEVAPESYIVSTLIPDLIDTMDDTNKKLAVAERLKTFQSEIRDPGFKDSFIIMSRSMARSATFDFYDFTKNTAKDILSEMEQEFSLDIHPEVKKTYIDRITSELHDHNSGKELIGALIPAFRYAQVSKVGMHKVLEKYAPSILSNPILKNVIAKNALETVPVDILYSVGMSTKDGKFNSDEFLINMAVNLGLGTSIGTIIDKAGTVKGYFKDRLLKVDWANADRSILKKDVANAIDGSDLGQVKVKDAKMPPDVEHYARELDGETEDFLVHGPGSSYMGIVEKKKALPFVDLMSKNSFVSPYFKLRNIPEMRKLSTDLADAAQKSNYFARNYAKIADEIRPLSEQDLAAYNWFLKYSRAISSDGEVAENIGKIRGKNATTLDALNGDSPEDVIREFLGKDATDEKVFKILDAGNKTLKGFDVTKKLYQDNLKMIDGESILKNSYKIEQLDNIIGAFKGIPIKEGKSYTEEFKRVIGELTDDGTLMRQGSKKLKPNQVERFLNRVDNINNWGVRDYISQAEMGNFQVMAKDINPDNGEEFNRLIAVGRTLEEAKSRFEDVYIGLKDTDPEQAENLFIGFDVYEDALTQNMKNSGLSPQAFHSLANSLKNGMNEMLGEKWVMSDDIVHEMKKFMKPNYHNTSNKAYNQFLKNRTELPEYQLSGDYVDSDVIERYFRSMYKSIYVNPKIAQWESIKGGYDKSVHEVIDSQINAIKGVTSETDKNITRWIENVYLTDKEDTKGLLQNTFKVTSLDKLLVESGNHYGLLKRTTNSIKGFNATRLLGGRPVSGLLQAVSGANTTFTMTGAKVFKRGLDELNTENMKAILKKNEYALGLHNLTDSEMWNTASFKSELKELVSKGNFKDKPKILRDIALRSFTFADPLVRKHSFSANYVYARDVLKMTDKDAIEEYARNGVRMQQFLYDTFELGQIFQGDFAKVALQFKPWIIKQAELMTQMSGKQMGRYIAGQMAITGTKGVFLTMASIPMVMSLVNAVNGSETVTTEHIEMGLNEMNLSLSESFGSSVGNAATYGLPGVLGLSASGAISPRLPQSQDDLLGPSVSLIKDVLNMYSEYSKSEYLGDAMTEVAIQSSPVIVNWRKSLMTMDNKGMMYYTSKEGAKTPIYQFDVNSYDYYNYLTAKFLGGTSTTEDFVSSAIRAGKVNVDIYNANAKRLSINIADAYRKGEDIAEKDMVMLNMLATRFKDPTNSVELMIKRVLNHPVGELGKNMLTEDKVKQIEMYIRKKALEL
jgi:hypothetical protein